MPLTVADFVLPCVITYVSWRISVVYNAISVGISDFDMQSVEVETNGLADIRESRHIRSISSVVTAWGYVRDGDNLDLDPPPRR
jgi:hypothetical protein